MLREEKSSDKLKFHVFRDERFIDLNLYQFGWERTVPNHSYGPHARNHYLFHYVISGRGQLFVNEQEYNITPGHGFLLSPGQVSTYRADGADPWVYVWLEFDGLRAHEGVHLAGLSAAPADADPAIAAMVDWVAPKNGGSGAVRSLAEFILHAQGKWDVLVKARYVQGKI